MTDNLVFGRMLADILTEEMSGYKVTYNAEKQNEETQELFWEHKVTGYKGTAEYHTHFLETYMYKKCTLNDIVFTMSQIVEQAHIEVASKQQEKIRKETAFKKEKDNIRIVIMKLDKYPDEQGNSVVHVVCPNENIIAVAVLLSEDAESYKIVDLKMPEKRWGVSVETIKKIAVENSMEHGVFVNQMSHKFNIVPFVMKVLCNI